MRAIEHRVVPTKLLLIRLAHVVRVGALEEQFLRPANVLVEDPVGLEADQVDDLVKLSLGDQGVDKALGIVEHVEAALTASMLLQHRYVPNLRTDRICMLLDIQVLKYLFDLHGRLILQSAAQGWLLIEWIQFVVVTFDYALILAHHDLRDQVKNDAPEEVLGFLLDLF